MKKKRATASSKKVKLYCVCQCDGNDGRFMVACDGCNNWFHPSCIGTTKQEVEKIKNFYCPKCREERSGATSSSASAAASTSSNSDSKSTAASSSTSTSSNPDSGKITKALSDVIGDVSFSEKVEQAIFARYGASESRQYVRRATSFLREMNRKRHLTFKTQFKEKVSNGKYTVEYLAGPESPLFGTLEDGAAAATTAAADGSDVDDDVTAAMTSSENPIPLKRACLDFSKCQNSEIAWKGTIQKNNKSNFGTFHVAGRLVLGSADVINLLPDTIEFAGRLITKKLCQYLHQLHRSKSRKFSVMRIDPLNDGDVDCFGSVFEYFTARKRSGSLQALNKVVPPEEMYLLPLLPNETLPLFLAESKETDVGIVNFEPNIPRLFLIVVAKIEHLKKEEISDVKKEGEEKKNEISDAKKEEEVKKEDENNNNNKMEVEKTEETKKDDVVVKEKEGDEKMDVEKNEQVKKEEGEKVNTEEVKKEVEKEEEVKKEPEVKKSESEEEEKTSSTSSEAKAEVKEVKEDAAPVTAAAADATTTTTTTQEIPVVENEKPEEKKD